MVGREHQHSLEDGEIFRLICLINAELWSSKFIELDVCGRPLFANPVTYIDHTKFNPFLPKLFCKIAEKTAGNELL